MSKSAKLKKVVGMRFGIDTLETIESAWLRFQPKHGRCSKQAFTEALVRAGLRLPRDEIDKLVIRG